MYKYRAGEFPWNQWDHQTQKIVFALICEAGFTEHAFESGEFDLSAVPDDIIISRVNYYEDTRLGQKEGMIEQFIRLKLDQLAEVAITARENGEIKKQKNPFNPKIAKTYEMEQFYWIRQAQMTEALPDPEHQALDMGDLLTQRWISLFLPENQKLQSWLEGLVDEPYNEGFTLQAQGAQVVLGRLICPLCRKQTQEVGVPCKPCLQELDEEDHVWVKSTQESEFGYD